VVIRGWRGTATRARGCGLSVLCGPGEEALGQADRDAVGGGRGEHERLLLAINGLKSPSAARAPRRTDTAPYSPSRSRAVRMRDWDRRSRCMTEPPKAPAKSCAAEPPLDGGMPATRRSAARSRQACSRIVSARFQVLAAGRPLTRAMERHGHERKAQSSGTGKSGKGRTRWRRPSCVPFLSVVVSALSRTSNPFLGRSWFFSSRAPAVDARTRPRATMRAASRAPRTQIRQPAAKGDAIVRVERAALAGRRSRECVPA